MEDSRKDDGDIAGEIFGTILGTILGTARVLATASHEDELLGEVCGSACDTLGFGAAAIALLDEDDCFRIKARTDRRKKRGCSDAGEFRLPLADLNLLLKIGTKIGDAVWIDGHDRMVGRLADRGSILDREISVESSAWNPRSMLLVPLYRPPHLLFGLLLPEDPSNGEPPSPIVAVLLSTLASFASLSIQLLESRIHGEVQRGILNAQRQRIAQVYRASGAVRRAGQLQAMLQATADAVTEAGGFGRAVIYLRQGEMLELMAISGLDSAEASDLANESPVPLALFSAIMQPQMRISRSYLLDCHRIPRGLEATMAIIGKGNSRSEGLSGEGCLSIPISDHQKLLGVISVGQPEEGRSPDLEQVQALEFFADQAGAAVAQMTYFDELKMLAERDPLTGLFNRRSFWNLVDQVASSASGAGLSLATLYIDIDHFKSINDEFGHEVGDKVISDVAKALSGRLRSQDVIARFGGEEFVVLVAGVDASQATSLAESLRLVVAAVGGAGFAGKLTISVGVAVTGGKSSAYSARILVEELVRRADAALYRAKVFGRNRVEIFR